LWPFIPRVIEKFLDLANLQRHNDNYNDIKSGMEDLAGPGRTNQTIKGSADTIAAHLADHVNPHVVTAAQVGAYTKTELQTSGQSTVHWNNLTNKPNFADARWGAPVATKAALDAIVATQDGEVRLVLQDETVYEWDIEIAGVNKWKAIGAIGDGLTSHSALNNLTNDDHPQYLRTDGTRVLTGDQDFAQHQAKNFVGDKSAIIPANPVEGQEWYDTVNHRKMLYKGSLQGWTDISGKGAVIKDQEFTALAGQTVFDITVGQYEISTNSITVYKKDVSTGKFELVPESEYTETNSTRFTLTSPATAGEVFYVKFFENTPEVINQSVKRDGTLQVNLNSDLLHGHDDTYFAPVSKFDPATGHKHTGAAGDAPQIDSTGLANGAATDTVLGNRTVDDTATPNTGPNTLTNILSFFGKMIRLITGENSWITAPRTTLKNAVKLDGDTMIGGLAAPTFTSTVADGTAPLVVTSKNKVLNFHADQLDGFDANATPTANTIPVRDANKNLLVDSLTTALGHRPNLLFNPSWRQGSAGWNGIGANGFQLSAGVSGEGGFLSNGTSSGAANVQVASVKIPYAPNVNVMASADMFTGGATTGEIRLQIDAFDASNVPLGGTVVVMGFGLGWTKKSTPVWKTPVNTAFITVSAILMANTAVTNGTVAWKNIKLENSTYPTAFSDDMLGATQLFPGSMWSDYNSAVSKAANGYVKLPNGLIIQWGQVMALANNGVTAITFPIAFPSTCLHVIGNSEVSSGGFGANFGSWTVSGANVWQDDTVNRNAHYLAIGY
jgi:hypothetical protein